MKGASRMTSSQAMLSLPSAGSFVRQSTSTQIQKMAARIMMPFMPRISRAKSQGNGLKNDIDFSSVPFSVDRTNQFPALPIHRDSGILCLYVWHPEQVVEFLMPHKSYPVAHCDTG